MGGFFFCDSGGVATHDIFFEKKYFEMTANELGKEMECETYSVAKYFVLHGDIFSAGIVGSSP